MANTLIDDMAAGIAPPIRAITVDELTRMLETGVLPEGEPIELIDGVLVWKDRRDPGAPEEFPMPQGPAHASAVRLIKRVFARCEPNPHWNLSIQLPVQIAPLHAPEPDASILRGAEEDYEDRHPAPTDVLVMFEASGTSLIYDQSTKQRIYATAGVPLYIVVNLEDRVVERYEEPDSALGRYTRTTILQPGDRLRLELPGTGTVEIPVADFLPRATESGSH